MKRFALVWCMLLVAGCSQPELKDQKPNPEVLKEKQAQAAREAIKKFIPEPESAKFRNQVGDCGEVSYLQNPQAFSTFKRFIVVEKNMVFIEDQIDQAQFELSWGNTCKAI